MKLRYTAIIAVLFLLTTAISAQEANWVPIELSSSKIFSQGTRMYVDVSKVNRFKGDDFYVWVLEEHNPPMKLESVRGDIYQTKTYYLFNKKLKRYSIQQVIYYDDNENVLDSFSYARETEIMEYKYNYPLREGSLMDKVYNKCIQFM